MTKGTIVVAGALAQKLGSGGHAWVMLQYLLGFRLLGWDVLLLDWLHPSECWDSSGRPCNLRESSQLQYLLDVLERYDLRFSFCLLEGGKRTTVGRTFKSLLSILRSSSLLININGYITEEEILGNAPRKLFLDIDPGFNQFWNHLDLAATLENHNLYATVGQNIGDDNCSIPTCRKSWIPTCPPVVLSFWPFTNVSNSRFTSVCSWRGLFGPVTDGKAVYGLRAHEFRKFLRLPSLSGGQFELALKIHPSDVEDLRALKENGWKLTNPESVASTPEQYQSYLQSSMAEFMVAKNMYVATKSGWFSDRTACYLASGKPAIVQDTGLGDLYPTGKGLITFSTLEEAVEQTESVRKEYSMHCRRARETAQNFFDSSRVLTKLLRAADLL